MESNLQRILAFFKLNVYNNANFVFCVVLYLLRGLNE